MFEQVVPVVSFTIAVGTFIFQFFGFVKNKTLLHISTCVILLISVSTTAYYWNKDQRKNKIALAANELIKHRSGDSVVTWGDQKFLMASLSFLEKNKDIYPESYLRAQKICKNNSCELAKYKDDLSDITSPYTYENNIGNAADSIEGILLGISLLER
ncbi:hypothetical protein MER72_04380 [Acinetobacter baumannii]|nr:hypothetical protein [Acinetobacter baumannii]